MNMDKAQVISLERTTKDPEFEFNTILHAATC